MLTVLDLWLPIVLAGIAGFFASFVCWALLPHHRAEWRKVPGEERMLDLVRDGVPPGQYLFPHAEHADLKDPERKKAYLAGPHGSLVVWPGPPNMGRNMAITMGSFLACAFLMAYVLSATIPAGASFARVFQVAATIGVMAHVFGLIPGAVWFGKPARALATEIADGVFYGLAQGTVFAFMWPELVAS